MAEIIFVMEKAHRNKLSEKFKKHLGKARVICLDTPDDYGLMDPVLIKIFKSKAPATYQMFNLVPDPLAN